MRIFKIDQIHINHKHEVIGKYAYILTYHPLCLNNYMVFLEIKKIILPGIFVYNTYALVLLHSPLCKICISYKLTSL